MDKTKCVKTTNEEGFDLANCFQTPNIKKLGYIKDEEDYYYDSYAHFSIHEEMLKDSIRTNAY
jgi:protein arginine N-methyltransferase 1